MQLLIDFFCQHLANALHLAQLIHAGVLDTLQPAEPCKQALAPFGANAADIFQPFFVVETVALALAIIASAFRWSERGAKGQKLVASIGQDSFGIYLGHVFLINYLVFLQPSGNDPITALLTLVIAVPSVYLISFVCVEIIRRTWFSLPITGRKRTPLRVERQVITNP